METTKEQITEFLNKCEEVKNCKFIMATTKIKDLLKAIVNSAELYELFNTVAANFDYVAAKQKCFSDDGGAFGQSKLTLPDTVGDRLAFIFCLLVEFDREDINLNAFLQKYYPKDGSYYASYHLFCDEVIGSLEFIICDVFAGELAEAQPQPQALLQNRTAQIPQSAASYSSPAPASRPAPNPQSAALINSACMLIESETESVENSSLSAEDKEAAKLMLESLSAAVREKNAALIKSLTCGYNYFVMTSGLVSDSLSMLFETLSNYLNSI